MSFSSKKLSKRTERIGFIKGATLFFLVMTCILFAVKAFEVVPIAPNAIQYIQQIFLTADGGNESDTGIMLDGRESGGVTIANLTGKIVLGTDSNGKIIASTSSDVYKYISGDIYEHLLSGTYYRSRNTISGNVYLTTSTDNVGIGTDAPTAKLDIEGDLRIGTVNQYEYSVVTGTRILALDDTTNIVHWIDRSDINPNSVIGGAISYRSRSNSNRYVYLTTGLDYVGIGTTGPTVALQVSGNFIAGASTNSIMTGIVSSIMGGAGNILTGGFSTIAGGNNNHIDGEAGFIGGGDSNTIQKVSIDDEGDLYDLGINAVIGGGRGNTIQGANYAYIGGGRGNRIFTGAGDFIGGGVGNMIYSSQSDFSSNTIVGGTNNIIDASTDAEEGVWNFIGGGLRNILTGAYSNNIGGEMNHLIGTYSTIPGGRYNVISGDSSFAAGNRAQALHDNVFIWNDNKDSQTDIFSSSKSNTFLVHASNGIGFSNEIESNMHIATGVTVQIDSILSLKPMIETQPVCDEGHIGNMFMYQTGTIGLSGSEAYPCYCGQASLGNNTGVQRRGFHGEWGGDVCGN